MRSGKDHQVQALLDGSVPSVGSEATMMPEFRRYDAKFFPLAKWRSADGTTSQLRRKYFARRVCPLSTTALVRNCRVDPVGIEVRRAQP
jgi:benzoyl-CoA reductase/2-hydroxyglutaryl-CoA dehydratase subunit BcrC/BadD/HgdB